MKEWLWLLTGWNLITGMPDTEKGVATAMSVGGRAAKIARSLDFAMLSQPWGLAYLIQRLEADLGSEVQERQKAAIAQFNAYARGKGTSYIDHIVNFELLLEEAERHGAYLNDVMKTSALLKTAHLSMEEERWCLQPAAGDLNQYQVIRASMRRLPWKSDAPLYQKTGEHYLGHREDFAGASGQQPMNLSGSALQTPPADPSFQCGQCNAEVDASAFFADPDEEDSGSDDFFEVDSDADSTDAVIWASAFALDQKKKKFVKRQGGAKPPFKPGFKKTAGMKPMQTRNSKPDLPKGMSQVDWDKRTPCPGCGSRWHLDCTKPRPPRPGFKRPATAARTMLGSLMMSLATATCVLCLQTAFPVFPVNSTCPTHEEWSFQGLEPFENREERYDQLLSSFGRLRYALVVDTGAADSAVGGTWVDDFIRDVLTPLGLEEDIQVGEQRVSFTGIGEGTVDSDCRARIPVGINGGKAEFEATVFEQGSARFLPGLLGLVSLIEKRATATVSGHEGSELRNEEARVAAAVEQVPPNVL